MSETSVFEMREMADLSAFLKDAEALIRSDAFAEYPHRDYDQLADAVDEADSLLQASRQLGTSGKQVAQWCEVYGLESPKQDQDTLASRLQSTDPSEVSSD